MPGTLNSALEEINMALRTSALPDALNATTELLTIYPMSVRAWRARAAALEADGQFNQASEAYGRVLDIVPSDAAALVAYARNLFAAGRADEADDAARQALDYDPDNALLRRYAHDGAGPAHIGTAGRVQFARNQFQSGLGNRAIAKLRGVLESHPSRVDTHIELADMLHRNSVRFTSAEICRHVLASHPNCLIANAILATHNQRIGNPDTAQQHMAVLTQVDPDGRETVALLGSRSPVQIKEAPTRQTASAGAAEDDESRSDWVDQLIASTSTPPAPVSSKVVVIPADPDTDENELLGQSIGAISSAPAAPAQTVVDDEHEATINFELPPLDWSVAGTSDDDVTNTIAGDVRVPLTDSAVTDTQRVTDEGVLVEPLDWSRDDNEFGADTPDIEIEQPTSSVTGSDTASAVSDDAGVADVDDDEVEAEAEVEDTVSDIADDVLDLDKPDDDGEAIVSEASDAETAESLTAERADAATLGESTNDDLGIGTEPEPQSNEQATGIVFGRSSRRPLSIERDAETPPAFIEHDSRLIRVDTMKPDLPVAKSSSRLKPADLLANARAAIDAEAFDEAAATYKQIVAKGRLIDEVIGDLNGAIGAHSGVIALHEALGIALTRKGDTQAALAAFREAQRLARG
jgi:tetratricopeptide (TPR) repeat protein